MADLSYILKANKKKEALKHRHIDNSICLMSHSAEYTY